MGLWVVLEEVEMRNLLGKALSLPIRIASIPVKLTEKAVGAIIYDDIRGLSRPIDRAADVVEEVVEEAMEDRR